MQTREATEVCTAAAQGHSGHTPKSAQGGRYIYVAAARAAARPHGFSNHALTIATLVIDFQVTRLDIIRSDSRWITNPTLPDFRTNENRLETTVIT